MPRTDPVAGAMHAYLTVSDEEDSPSTSPPSCSTVSIHTSARANAVVRTLRIPWCDGHLQWKLLQDLAAPFAPEDAFDVVCDDPDFAPDLTPEEEQDATPTTTSEPGCAAAVALVASLLHQYRARQLELLAACPDERVQLELALLQPLLEQEEQEQEDEARLQRRPKPPPRLQLRLVSPSRRNSPARACFSVPLVGVKRACLGPLLDYLMGAGTSSDNNDNHGSDADIRGLALVASFDVSSSSSSTTNNQNLRLSLSAPAWLRRAGLPPMPLPPIGASASARPPLADYSSDTAARLAAHLKAQAPRAAARYALVDALAAVFGAAPLEVVASTRDSELATPPPGADGGGGGSTTTGGGGWSAVVARGRPAQPSSSSASLAALFPLLLDAQPLLLAVEIGARFPDEQPLLRVTRALGPSGGGGAAASAGGGKRKTTNPAAELAEAGEATVSGYPWSPRWPPEEQAARIYNHLASALAS